MKPRHIAVAVLIAAIWGVNFVVIRVGLDDLPPLLFASLRFVPAFFPAVFFVRRPAISWGRLALIGLPLCAGQFALVFISLRMGMPAGLSSLVLQAQALFTTVFAALMLRERPGPRRLAGMAVAFGGIALIAVTLGQAGPVLAFALCLGGAAMWGLGNIGLRTARVTDAFSFMVWVSLVPPLPLLALSLIFEGPRADLHALAGISIAGIGSLLYIAYLSTLVGFGYWGWLMQRYDASQVSMYSLLVPPFGLSAAALFLGERITATDVVAALLIVGGVAYGSIPRRTRPEITTAGAELTGGPVCVESTSRS